MLGSSALGVLGLGFRVWGFGSQHDAQMLRDGVQRRGAEPFGVSGRARWAGSGFSRCGGSSARAYGGFSKGFWVYKAHCCGALGTGPSRFVS